MDSSSSSHHQGSLGSTNPRKGNPALAANFRNQCGSNSPSPLKLSSPPKRPNAKKKTKPTVDGSTRGQIPDGGEKWRVPQPGIGSVTCTLVDQLDAGKPFLLPTPSPNINPPTNCKSLQGQSGDTKVSHASHNHNGKEDGHIESGTSKITRNPKRRKKKTQKSNAPLPSEATPTSLSHAGKEILKLVNGGPKPNHTDGVITKPTYKNATGPISPTGPINPTSTTGRTSTNSPTSPKSPTSTTSSNGTNGPTSPKGPTSAKLNHTQATNGKMEKPNNDDAKARSGGQNLQNRSMGNFNPPKPKDTIEKADTNNSNSKKLSNTASKVDSTSKMAVPPTISPSLEQLGLKQAEARLNKEYIFALEKKSEDYPSAIFVCRLCNYHLDSVPLSHRHIKVKRHRKALKEKQQDNLLRELSLPPASAIAHLQEVLLTNVLVTALSETDVERRAKVVEQLEENINLQIPGCRVVMYGSSCSGLGTTTSNLNVDVEYPSNMRAPATLIKCLEILQHSDLYSEVESDFLAKTPRIYFVDKQSGLHVSLSTGNECAIYTSRLLRFYTLLDPRVKQLCLVFRRWASMCRLDLQQEGSMPPHAFSIMAIFFMQKHNYLPILHELIAEHDLMTMMKCPTVSNCELLDFQSSSCWYRATSPPTSPSSPVKNANPIDDDSESDNDGGNNTTIDNLVSESPDTEPDSPLGDSSERSSHPSIDLSKPVDLKSGLEGRQRCVAELWLDMLQFYALEYPIEDQIICICTRKNLARSDKNWSKKRVAVVDPFSTKRNLCRSMAQPTVFSYMMLRLKAAVTYFYAPHSSKLTPEHLVPQVSCGVTSDDPSTSNSPEQADSSGLDEVTTSICDIAIHDALDDMATPKYRYEFTEVVVTGGSYPAKVCALCKREGHIKKDCPDEAKVADLEDLPPPTAAVYDALERVCNFMYENNFPKKAEITERNNICDTLMTFLQKKFDTKCRMNLFGSSRNGFGFKKSDLDICMTFDGNATGEDLDFVQIIKDVARCLRKNKDLHNILPITTAKVPIVKFEHRSGLEGDISLYNLLAQQNTLMLSCYSKVDCRCKVLGYAMKVFVKSCQIGDASRGSLSSYAYTLMVIFYLQQRNPPVLPVLQQLYEGGESPVKEIDGWNAWFNSDISSLVDTWPEFGANKESIGELWYGMLKFYTEEFSFRHNVISIRQKQPLTVFEKEWTSKYISIEDPFDLNHNLGAGVSHKMSNFIVRVFVRARKHFSSLPVDCQLHQEPSYFFDANILMDGEEAPNDRCCRVCGKIGHFVRDCPKKRRGRRDNGQTDGKDLSDYRCFSCGGYGHIKKDCPGNNIEEAVPHPSNFGPQNKFLPGSSPRNQEYQPRNFRSPKFTHQGNKMQRTPNTHTPPPGTRDPRRASPHTPLRNNGAKTNLFPTSAPDVRSHEGNTHQSSPKQIPDKRRPPNLAQWHSPHNPPFPTSLSPSGPAFPFNQSPNALFPGYHSNMMDNDNGFRDPTNPPIHRTRNPPFPPSTQRPRIPHGHQGSPGSRSPMGLSPHYPTHRTSK